MPLARGHRGVRRQVAGYGVAHYLNDALDVPVGSSFRCDDEDGMVDVAR